MKIVGLAMLAMMAFAANSVLARLALGGGDMSAAGYSGLRLMSGAIVLVAIIFFRGQKSDRRRMGIDGSWQGAAALLGYALAFSIAYIMLGAATGALILFASVQVGMVTWAILNGDRPGLAEWLGFGIAFAALVILVSPGLVAPSPLGTALMVAAGLCWAAYSLLGRGSQAPLADTAGNFIRCLPIALALMLAGELSHASASGLAYAIASGAIASGVGYAIWYAVLPSLSRTSAALVQLTVPAIAAAGGVVFIGEQLTGRLLLCSAGILGGVTLALLAANRRQAKASRADAI